ncbi:MAG: ATP-dependent RecD-like DNA helicase [Oscillospiraceae bacterium]|nr:ATP-dependent RecD-like DNA helicase [Oscillospiraceae bacterium]
MNEQDCPDELQGVVEAVSFRNDENSFTVMDVACGGELVTAVGVLPQVTAGEALLLRGRWRFHPTYGKQFDAQLCQRSMPVTQSEVLKYLGSGMIKGVRGTTAQRIIETFGDQTIDVLKNHPGRLAGIRGISAEKAEQISESFCKQFSLRQVMISLERLGLTTAECLRAYKAYGPRTAELVLQNPYLLCEGEPGVGFARADSIAQALPAPPDALQRAIAGVLHVMRRHCYQNGHTCMPAARLPEPCAALLQIALPQAQAAIDQLLDEKRLVAYAPLKDEKNTLIFLPALFKAEKNCAVRIGDILAFPPAKTEWDGDFDTLVTRMEDAHGIHYDELQRQAMRIAMEQGLLLLTGGPGTGKTTTLKGILQLFLAAKLKVALTAPTGRAAKRMQELTGQDAKTIHRLLEVEWGEDDHQRFARHRQNPLPVQAVIVDEVSMVDTALFSALLDALPLGCRLVLVGDADQLPPVGAGCVLQELMKVDALTGAESAGTHHFLPVVRLTKIFRQALESLIVVNSHAIVRGELPALDAKEGDFFFLERQNGARAAQTIVQLCGTRLPKAYGYNPLGDIQVLCPSRKGACGTGRLNELLQETLNPQNGHKKEHRVGHRLFREGDKVMQIKNNYDLLWQRPGDAEGGMGVYNGDIGVIEKILPPEGIFKIRFDDDRVTEYPFDAASEELEHAYAVTVHKSQGSEFPAVVIPVVGVTELLCYRNLLYTAVTRAKKLLILVGSRQTLAQMVANHHKSLRFSALAAMLCEGRAAG